MFGFNDLNKLTNRDALFDDLMDVLEDAIEDGNETAQRVKFSIKCADFETKLQDFVQKQDVSQREVVAVLSTILGRLCKTAANPIGSYQQVCDNINKVLRG